MAYTGTLWGKEHVKISVLIILHYQLNFKADMNSLCVKEHLEF